MPPRRSNVAPPPPTMTWSRAAPVLTLCAVFDALRGFFSLFWLFGPALLGLYCTAKVSEWVGLAWGLTPAACGAAATGIGYVGSPVFATIGFVMAFAVGLLGWMTVGLILFMTNSRIFKENALWFIGSLAISEVPFVGSLPALTVSVARMYRTQIHKERAALKKYEEGRKAALARERAERLAELEQHMFAERAAQQEEIPEEMPKAA